MDNKYNENADSENGENENENSSNENQEGDEPDLDALKKVKEELSDKNKKLFERAKKSEGEVKELRDQIKKLAGEHSPEDKNLEKSQLNEPDYAKLAFLETKGVNHPDDQKLVQDEASRLKLPLTDILNMEYVKARLSALKDQREAQAGMPKGRGSSGSSNQGDVDYWLAKGETPDDQELAEKVIEARIHKEKQANKFSDDLYVG